MNRRTRTASAFLVAFALVFAQLAVSAHACVPHEMAGKAEAMVHPEGCPGMAGQDEAPAGESVCAAHCQYGAVSVDNVQPVPAAIDVAGPALRLELATAIAGSTAIASWRLAPTAAPPPPALLFGVLRI